MSRRWQFVISVVSLLVAAAVAVVGYRQYDRLVTTVEVPAAAVPIDAYTFITPAMLTTKEFPRAIAGEAIYLSGGDLAGKITTVPLVPGMLIYRAFAVEPRDFRLSADAALEVVSFPVSPVSAVGGQVRRGQHINIYRAVVMPALIQSFGFTSPEQLLEIHAAAAQVLAENVPVVDVRSQQGEPVQAASDDGSGSGRSPASSNRQPPPLQIVTVAVPPEIARQIVQLVAEGQAQVQLWVSLAPLSAAVAAAETPTP